MKTRQAMAYQTLRKWLFNGNNIAEGTLQTTS